MSESENSGIESIAIIGMVGRFPGAADVDQFWRNLCNGVESVTSFSDEELLAAGVLTRHARGSADVVAILVPIVELTQQLQATGERIDGAGIE